MQAYRLILVCRIFLIFFDFFYDFFFFLSNAISHILLLFLFQMQLDEIPVENRKELDGIIADSDIICRNT